LEHLSKPPVGRGERIRLRLALALVVASLVVVGLGAWLLLRAPAEPPEAPPAPAPTRSPTPELRPSGTPSPTGTVEVSSSAPGSTVLVDGRRLGPAPQTIDLEAGAHSVRVEKEGFQVFEQEVQIIPGRTLKLEARLEVVAPHLRVVADVAGAQVFLDRKFMGEAPVTVRDVAPGRHRLNVSAEGYEMYAEDLEIASGTQEVVVNFKEVRLDEAIAVKHKHGMGSCRGRLVATTDGLRYETDHKKDGFTAAFPTLEPLEVDYLDKNLRVKVRGGRKYNFTAEDADDLLVFQQAVEAARARLQ
jgi:hypothetical protein